MNAATRHADGSDLRLRALATLARRAGASQVALEAEDLADRIAAGRFYLACLGQFKRGKSTLLNALVGHDLLPTGVLPVTSVITILRHGAALGAIARRADGTSEEVAPGELAELVTEERNPGNVKGVRVVEVTVPSPLLAEGMCLVDTPGLGSVFTSNTAVTEGFVPHIDAALLVVGADPPITRDEVELALRVARTVPHLLVALNKADQASERTVETSARFAADLLERGLERRIERIFRVSATEARVLGPTRDWAALLQALRALSAGAGGTIVREAEGRGFHRLAAAVARELGERRGALTRPVEESRRRIADLRREVDAAERAMADLGALLAAEQARLTADYIARYERFLTAAQRAAEASLAASIPELPLPSIRLREAAFSEARRVAAATVSGFEAELGPVAEALYVSAMERFVQLANAFLVRIGGRPGMESLPGTLGPEEHFRVPGEFRYAELLHAASDHPLAWLPDVLRPRRFTVRSVTRAAQRYAARLIETNGSRVTHDLVARAAESRRRLEGEVRSRLRDVAAVAERALADAGEKLLAGEGAVRAELERLDALAAELEHLQSNQRRGEAHERDREGVGA